jgi:hypothetical protein
MEVMVWFMMELTNIIRHVKDIQITIYLTTPIIIHPLFGENNTKNILPVLESTFDHILM